MTYSIVGLLSIVLVTSSSAFAAISYDCTGTEPFWDMQIRDKHITFNTPERTISGIRVIENLNAEGIAAAFLQYMRAKTPGGYPVTAIVNANETCSDGMSDEKYSYQAIVQISGRVFFGCCNQAVK